jgi:hypothetical protein
MKDTSGPAFPTHPEGSLIHDGMSLRDYFAAGVMQGVLANGNLPRFTPDLDVAEYSYRLADAMLARRKT